MGCIYKGVEYSEGSSICVGGNEKICTHEGTWEFSGNACEDKKKKILKGDKAKKKKWKQ
ncbi:hypothetical protein [Cyclobacterium sp. SYSU L10401]|uniref:hypothetical protein n=1 Tax=Cyclobacterium sp. SYSU L10401 TaxID=2678657 RepID=UPI001969C998|nr:hypothetical protein [Cyclobacterium sp. SYSU L10401]